MFKTLFLFCTTLIIATSCSTSKNAYNDIYPKSLEEGVYFDMPLEEFKTLKSIDSSMMIDDGFRSIYVENIKEGSVSDIVYYFDADKNAPLYEMIFIYNDTLVRNADAKALFGAPNDGKEWRFNRKPYDISAWTFKNKLIIAALIPLTEWADEEE